MNRNDEFRKTKLRSFMMGHVEHVNLVPLQCNRNSAMVDPRAVALLVELREVAGERSEFVEIAAGSYKEIFVLVIDRPEMPHEIPDVRTNAEFIDLTNINCDPHDWIAGISLPFNI